MPSFFDPTYVAAARSVPVHNYLQDIEQGFQLADSFPWSARKQRERAVQDYQLMMQQQRFQAEMADKAHDAQLQNLLLPYKIQQMKAMAARYAQPTDGGVVNKVQNWFAQPSGGDAAGANLDGSPTVLDSPEMSPLPEDGIPDPLPTQPVAAPADILPPNVVPPQYQHLQPPRVGQPSMSYFPDAPVF